MDTAEAEHLKQPLTSQGALIGQHDGTLLRALEVLQQLMSSVDWLSSSFENLLTQQ